MMVKADHSDGIISSGTDRDLFSQFQGLKKRVKELLKNNNQVWAIDVCNNILKSIDRAKISPNQSISFINELVTLWQDHIKALVADFVNNWPFIYNAYHYLFDLFLHMKDHARITKNGIRLAQILMRIQFATNEQISELLEELSVLTFKSNNSRKGIQLMLLSIFFRRGYRKNIYFQKGMDELANLFRYLSPDERKIVLDALLMETLDEFFGDMRVGGAITDVDSTHGANQYHINDMEVSPGSFLDEIYRAVSHSVHDSIRSSLIDIKKMYRQIRDRKYIKDEILDVLSHLQLLRRFNWSSLIVEKYIRYLVAHNQQNEVFSFLEGYIDESYAQGAFQSCFDAYMLAEEIIKESLKGIDDQQLKEKRFEVFIELSKLWSKALDQFKNLGSHTYYARAADKFFTLFGRFGVYYDYKTFQTYLLILDEFYKTIHGRIRFPDWVFWMVILQRAVFEEGMEDIADYILGQFHLDSEPYGTSIKKDIASTLKWKKELKTGVSLFEREDDPLKSIRFKLRLSDEKGIKIYVLLMYQSGLIREELVYFDEPWVDPVLLGLYREKHPFLGKIAYLLLPKDLRTLLHRLHPKEDIVPEIFVIQDSPLIPLELMHDGTLPMGVRYSFGYRFREPPLSESKSLVYMVDMDAISQELVKKGGYFNILSIGAMNQKNPTIWSESEKRSVAYYPFSEGVENFEAFGQHCTDLKQFVREHHALLPEMATFDNIQKFLISGSNHIIYISSTLFYLDEMPENSYFITSDGQILSLSSINEMLSYAETHNKVQKMPFIKPILIFDGRIVHNGKVVESPFKIAAKILKHLSSVNFMGVIARVSNVYMDEVRFWFHVFLERIFLGDSIGKSMSTANKHLYLKARAFLRENPDGIKEFNRMTTTHYVLFGDPHMGIDVSELFSEKSLPKEGKNN